MRVQQRRFVVEFKSRSRQTKANKPASIWGDADLKAAVRQVEEQSPHLFAQPTAEPVTDTAVLPPDAGLPPAAESSPAKSFVSTAAEAPLAQSDDVAMAELHLALEIEDKVRQPIERSSANSETPIVQLPDAPSSSDSTPRPGRAVPSNAQATPVAEMRDPYVSRADLIALEHENHRLKMLLRAKLLAENACLKERLLRFS